MSTSTNRVVIAGYGRTGQNIAQGLQDAGVPYIIVDIDPERVSDARSSRRPRIYGDASNPRVLSRANLAKARTLVVTFPDPMAVIATVKNALEINPKLKVVARVHRVQEAELLRTLGDVELIMPEYEASLKFLERIFFVSGRTNSDIRQTLLAIQKNQEFGLDEEKP